MANTVIQFKRSNATSAPTNGTLAAAEPAYSFNSDKLFVGNTAGTGVLEVGGKFYVDMTQTAYAQANAAYAQANASANSATVVAAFGQANTARDHANSAFLQANTARDQANTAFSGANAAIIQANTARDQANIAFTSSNAAWIQANTARTHANTAHETANAAFDQANTARTHANTAHLTANAAFDQANTARTHANSAYEFANTRFSSSGGTITGNVSIVGTLTLSGNTQFQNVTTLSIGDPLIYLAANNYSSDIVDIGFIANYVNATGSNVHTGFYREHTNKEYYLFYGYDQEPDNNHIDSTGNNFTIAVLNADVRTSNLNLGGVNAISWIRSTFDQANTARTHANAAHLTANTSYDQANTARNHANTAHLTANASFDQANTARNHANTAHDTANASLIQANTARDHANVSFAHANAAFLKANGAAYLAFGTVTVSGTNLVADSNNDTLSITSGNGVILIADSAADSFNVSLSPTGVTGATYGGAATVGVFTVDTWGRITSASNAAIAISADAVTSGTLPVGRGGTGVTTFTTNGVLYGQGASALAVTSAGTEGQVLQASAAGIPNFAMLDGGTF